MEHNIDHSVGIGEKWFLEEKKIIDAVLNDDCVELSVVEFAAKAKSKIGMFLKLDTRSPIERAISRDNFGRMFLDMMREVRTLGSIRTRLRAMFGLDLSSQQVADYARARFVNEYDLYLKRLYLAYYSGEIAWILSQNHNKSVNEQFLIFLSSHKSNCVEMGVGVNDFEFSINFVNPCLFRVSPAEMAKKILEERVENDTAD